MRRGECTDVSQVGQRHRMAATGIDAQLDVYTTHLIGTLLVNQGRQLIDIEIALERLARCQIVSGLADHVDHFGAVHFDVKARRGKKHVAGDYGIGLYMNLAPNPLRRPALRGGDDVGKAKKILNLLHQERVGSACFSGQSHARLDEFRSGQSSQLIGAQRADTAVRAQIDVDPILRNKLGIEMSRAQDLEALTQGRLTHWPHHGDFVRHGKNYPWRALVHSDPDPTTRNERWIALNQQIENIYFAAHGLPCAPGGGCYRSRAVSMDQARCTILRSVANLSCLIACSIGNQRASSASWSWSRTSPRI